RRLPRLCSWLLSLWGAQVEQGQDALRLLIDDDLRAKSRHDVLQGLDIDAAPRHLRGLVVLRQQGAEPSDIAFRLVDPLQAVTVGLSDPLILLALGQRDHLVVVPPGLIDELLLLLL